MNNPTANLGRLVKWQDDDEAWHTGRVVLHLNDHELSIAPANHHYDEYKLVKESCCGSLTWVKSKRLLDWALRSEWEKDEVPETFEPPLCMV